jgi:hypothetical protein
VFTRGFASSQAARKMNLFQPYDTNTKNAFVVNWNAEKSKKYLNYIKSVFFFLSLGSSPITSYQQQIILQLKKLFFFAKVFSFLYYSPCGDSIFIIFRIVLLHTKMRKFGLCVDKVLKNLNYFNFEILVKLSNIKLKII